MAAFSESDHIGDLKIGTPVATFFTSDHIGDLEIGTPVATLPATWRDRVSAETGWHCVGLLWVRRQVDLQLLSQCGNSYSCLSRSIPAILWFVAGTFSNETTTLLFLSVSLLCMCLCFCLSCTHYLKMQTLTAVLAKNGIAYQVISSWRSFSLLSFCLSVPSL